MSARGTAGVGADELVGLEEIRAAAKRLRGVSRRTPLHGTEIELPAGGAAPERVDGGDGAAEGRGGHPVWLKCESLQHGGAFKVRGAYNFVSRLSPEERDAGLITFSSGNHAQGVAYAAREFGLEALIVMPEDAPQVKRRATRALGATVVFEGYTTEERQARALEIASEEGYTVVPPFDHRDIVAGQGTVGIELVEQLREGAGRDPDRDPEGPGARPGLVLVPIGGGGLLSGTAAALRALTPECRVVGVEPEGAASMRASLDAGEPVTLDEVESVADGLKPVRPGDVTFRHVRDLVDDVVTVTDAAIREATVWCAREHLVVEPSGAATVAALASGRVGDVPMPEEGATVAVLSGGNVDTDLLGRWLLEA